MMFDLKYFFGHCRALTLRALVPLSVINSIFERIMGGLKIYMPMARIKLLLKNVS